MKRIADLLRIWGAGLILLIGLALPLSAQSTEEIRAMSAEWQKTATRAEQVIDANRASNAALEQLRSELARFRQTFLSSGTDNADRIRTLEGQLEALGPPPAEGETEAEDIAQLRASLRDQLTDLRVQQVVSAEAYRRAQRLVARTAQPLLTAVTQTLP